MRTIGGMRSQFEPEEREPEKYMQSSSNITGHTCHWWGSVLFAKFHESGGESCNLTD